MKLFKNSVIAELYESKLIPRSLLFQLSEAIENNYKENHEKKIESKLELIRYLPPIYQIPAVDMLLHSNRKVSENAFFRGMEDSIIKELLHNSHFLTVPAREFIYHTRQPADAGTLLMTSVPDNEGARGPAGTAGVGVQAGRAGVVLRRRGGAAAAAAIVHGAGGGGLQPAGAQHGRAGGHAGHVPPPPPSPAPPHAPTGDRPRLRAGTVQGLQRHHRQRPLLAQRRARPGQGARVPQPMARVHAKQATGR